MAQDPFLVDSKPSGEMVAITAADADIKPFRGIMINGVGTLIITDMQGNVVTLAAPAVGVIHSIRGKRVAAASTATGIVGFY